MHAAHRKNNSNYPKLPPQNVHELYVPRINYVLIIVFVREKYMKPEIFYFGESVSDELQSFRPKLR